MDLGTGMSMTVLAARAHDSQDDVLRWAQLQAVCSRGAMVTWPSDVSCQDSFDDLVCNHSTDSMHVRLA